MEKIRVGFTVDHTFRNLYGKIKDLYERYYIEELVGEIPDEELPRLTLPINTNNLMNHIPFTSEEEMFEFIFSEFPLEIFGYSKEVEKGSIMEFNSWSKKYSEKFDIFLISNEIDRTKPSTLFFLSKLGFQGDKIIFINDSVDIWEYCDILITSNELNNKKPDGKHLFIVDRLFNRQIEDGIRVSSLFEFFDLNLDTVTNNKN